MERKGKAAAVVAALSLALSLPFSLFSLSAYADTPVQTYTLTSAQTVALFGNSMDVTYMAEGTADTGFLPYEKTVSASYINTQSISGGTFYSPDGLTYTSRQFVWYGFQAADMVNTSTWNLHVQTALDLDDVTYCDTGIITYMPSFDFSAVPYATQDWYWYYKTGGVGHTADPLRQGEPGLSGYGYYGILYHSGSSPSMVVPILYSGASTSIQFGDAQVKSDVTPSPQSLYLVGIICPIISTYSYAGNNGAGDRPADSGSDSGGSGSGGADLTNVENKLDDIIDQLEQIIQNTAQSSPDSGDANDYHNDKSQNASEMQQGKNYQAQIDSVVNADGGSTPEFENEYTMANEFNSLWTYKDTSGNTQQNTFLIALPIITITIGGLAYVVFGRMK